MIVVDVKISECPSTRCRVMILDSMKWHITISQICSRLRSDSVCWMGFTYARPPAVICSVDDLRSCQIRRGSADGRSLMPPGNDIPALYEGEPPSACLRLAAACSSRRFGGDTPNPFFDKSCSDGESLSGNELLWVHPLITRCSL